MSSLVAGIRAFLSPQFLRFAVVGLVSNGILYLMYLALTGIAFGPKVAATLTYAMGVAQTFWANRIWTFMYRGNTRLALIRYLCVYAAGYVLNLLALYLLVDIAGLDHRWVQGTLILMLAGLIFLSLRFWAFRMSAVSGATAR